MKAAGVMNGNARIQDYMQDLKGQLLEERRNPIQISPFFKLQQELDYLNNKLAWYVVRGDSEMDFEMVTDLKDRIVAFQDKVWMIVRNPS